MIGKTVSHYYMLEELGSGGMGVVYKAEDTRLKRFVAVKFLSEHISKDHLALQRFQREAEAASGLNHPNICTIHDVGESEGAPFIVMEFLEGQTLRKLIGGQRLSTERVVDLGIQIADALVAAHDKGILHRDIKPANIFVTQRDQVKIVDFGLAKLTPWLSRDSSTVSSLPTVEPATDPGSIMGTPNYMSPEQAQAQSLDVRSDLFSTGAVLYEMCTGQLAFPGTTRALVSDAILHRDPISALRLNPHLPEKMAEIINKALEKDREVRYQHASEIGADLKRLKRDSDARLPRRGTETQQGAQLRGTSRKDTPILRIAVLPLQNTTANPETEFLADGISESLISSLSQLPTVRVISQMSAFRYRGTTVDPLAVGRELNVGAILVGRIITREDSLSVTLELIDTHDNSFMWGERYDRKLADLVVLEEQIADRVADKLQVKLKVGEKRSLPRRPTRNSEALQLYLKGRYHWNKRSTDSLKKGLDCFNQAIDIDPGYALAYAGVADSYSMLVWNIAVSSHQGLPKARAAAVKALEIDNRLAEGHASLAFVKLFYEWDWKGAEAEFQRTFELKRNYAMAPQWYAMELAALGRYEEAVRTTDRALHLDPLSNSINATSGLTLYFARQFEPALEHCRKTIEQDPNFFGSRFVCGLNYEQMGRYEEAIAEFQASVDLSSRLPLFLAALGHAYAVSGKREEAQRMIDEIGDVSKHTYRSSYAVAAIYAGLGETAQALEWLERACDERATWMIFLKVHPYFDNLDAEPRFQDLLKRLQFET